MKSPIATIEARVERLISSDALVTCIGRGDELDLYFRRDRVSADDLQLRSDDRLHSALDLPSGQSMRGSIAVFGSMTERGSYIRLSVLHPFYIAQPLDTVIDPTCRGVGRKETFAQTTPGIERLRTAINRLISVVPCRS